MSSVAMDALTHGALEGGVGPGADPGLEIGRDVGAVDDPERCLESSAARVESTIGLGVTDGAVAERGKLPAAGDGGGRIHRRIRPRDRRDRAPRQRSGSDAGHRGA